MLGFFDDDAEEDEDEDEEDDEEEDDDADDDLDEEFDELFERLLSDCCRLSRFVDSLPSRPPDEFGLKRSSRSLESL